jgi:hypothetical protein
MVNGSDFSSGSLGRRGVVLGVLGVAGGALAGRSAQPENSTTLYIPLSQKGAASGVAALDADGNVLTGAPSSQVVAEVARVEGIAYVADHRFHDGIDPTGKTDSSAGLNHLINGLPAGSTLIIPEGIYRIDESLQNVDADGAAKSIAVVGYGATLVRSGPAATVVFRGGFESAHKVVGGPRPIGLVAQGSVDGNSLIPGTEIDLIQVPRDWREGDIVKLVADDTAVGARVTEKSNPGGARLNRVGQFLTIADISGRQVRLTGELRDDFVDNVRVARISDVTASLRGLTFDVTDDVIANTGWSAEHVRLSSMIMPSVTDIRIVRGDGAGVQFVSCYGFSMRDSTVQFLVDDPENKRFGYGVINNQSFGGTVDGCVFSRVRHAFTDGVVSSAINDSSFARYGRPEFTVVSNSTCTAATASAWNTHHGGRGTVFINCTAIGGRNSFALRGTGHRILGGLAKDVGGPAVALYLDNPQGDSDSHLVDGLSVENAQTVLRSNLVSEQRPSVFANIRARGISRSAMDIGGSEVIAENWTVEMAGRVDNTADKGLISVLRDSVLDARSVVIDCRRTTVIDGPGLVLLDAGGDIQKDQILDARGVVLRNTEGQFQQLMRNGKQTTRYVHVEADAEFSPAEGAPVASAAAAGGWVDYTVRGRSTNSGRIAVSGARISDGSTADLVAMCRTTVFLDCAPSGSNRTLVSLPDGHEYGQELFIRHAGEADELEVEDGSRGNTSLRPPGSTRLTPGQVLHLGWLPSGSSARWVQLGAIG